MSSPLRLWLLPLMLALPAGAPAEQPPFRPPASEQDAVRRSVLEGDLKPLADVMQEVLRIFPGRVVEIELEDDDGRMVYEFDIVTTDGRLIEVDADAVTGAVIGMEEEDEDG